MKFAIIAAGEGSRLTNEGINTPKPLVCLNGEPMIDRLIRIFLANNASSVSIIVNREMNEVYEHVRKIKSTVPLNIIHKSTPSSMHSFYELSHTLGNEKFCLTTVDTVFREEEFSKYIDAFNKCSADGLFAVTDYIDDEKPLFIETDDEMSIKGFYDENICEIDKAADIHKTGSVNYSDDNNRRFRYVSGGIYCLGNKSIPVLKTSIEVGMSKLRNFQRQLVKNEFKLQAWPFSKIIDVDHKEDIHKAELFLKNIDY